MRNLLLDTGPLVALLDRSERQHETCVSFLKDFQGRLITTEPVLTEAVYLLGPSLKGQKACIEFILKGGASLVPQSVGSLKRGLRLMEKYGDIPMDFADATLVVLAEEAGISDVFTLDRKGFSAYRIRGRKRFTIWPEFSAR
jgi:predicted nucleic acid-binding protein